MEPIDPAEPGVAPARSGHPRRDLAAYLARRFANRGQPLQDLTVVARAALATAVNDFDQTRGVDFDTFATTAIVSDLKAYVRQNGWAPGSPRRTLAVYRVIEEVVDPLSRSLGRPPTVATLAQAAGASEEDVLEALEEAESRSISSYYIAFEAPARRAGTDAGGSDVSARATLVETMRALPPREQKVLGLRVLEKLPREEIARRMNLPQTAISRILATAVARLHTVEHARSTERAGDAGRESPG
jgi:RNA polymerase sigma-B factor